jgi:Spy/CpxP family protein refolding chaperone
MMMNTQLTLIGLILSLTMSVTAFAEENYHHTGDSTTRVEHLTKALDLNADQQAKVKALFDAQEVKLKAIHEETKTSLQAILTPEQSAKLEAAHAKHKAEGKDKK